MKARGLIAVATLANTIALLSGCKHFSTTTAESAAPSQPSSLVATPLPLEGEQAILLASEHWLAVSPNAGMQVGSNDSLKSRIQSEYLDVRWRENTGQWLVATLNTENRIQLATLAPSNTADNEIQLLKTSTSKALPYPVEGLCLYQPEGTNNLELFVLDEEAVGHQLLLTESGEQLSINEIRHFPLPPASEYCVVDDVTDQLFVSEEGIGLWAYNARAESDIRRSVVDLVAPYGNLNENPGPMAIYQGNLFMAEVGSALIHRYQIRAVSAEYQQTQLVTYPASLQPQDSAQPAIESLTLLQNSANQPGPDNDTHLAQAALYDDELGQLISVQLVSTAPQASTDKPIVIPASGETQAVQSAGDAADDPAIWVNPNNPGQSRIIGTDKKRGLLVYDLNGKELQDLPVGRVNNVDVRQGFHLYGNSMDIAAASHRDHNSIALFAINPTSGKTIVAGEVPTTLDEVYGFCLYQSDTGVYAFINDEDGRFEQYQILDGKKGWTGKKVRAFAVQSQPEGCVADDQAKRLFLGEENRAVWTLGAEPNDSTTLTAIAELDGHNGDYLVADIEGMDIYQTAQRGYLVVSSQGNDSYAVFDTQAPYPYLGRFRVGLNANLKIDGASETDGLTVSSANLGAQYPAGMLVVQDGRNLLPNEKQNFKMVDWRDIQAALHLK